MKEDKKQRDAHYAEQIEIQYKRMINPNYFACKRKRKSMSKTYSKK